MNALAYIGIIVAVLFVAWCLVNLKKSRPDGTFIERVHPYRRILWYIMPTRNESVVYFDEYIDATKLLPYLDEAREHFDVDVTHAIVAACAMGFAENPEMNRFISGYRMYERDGIYLSFSMKRKQIDPTAKKAKLAAVKMEIEEGMTFRNFCEDVNEKIHVQRSGKKTYSDKEFALFNMVPRPVFHRLFRLFRQLDYWNLLPASFIENDPMYTSMFIANLGSLKMGAGFHHLYEWGTCPLFMMAGQIEEKPVVEDGEVVIKPMLHVRFSYDERIDDGMTAGYGIRTFKEVMEDPYVGLGCLAGDGSDAWSLTTPRDERGAPRPTSTEPTSPAQPEESEEPEETRPIAEPVASTEPAETAGEEPAQPPAEDEAAEAAVPSEETSEEASETASENKGLKLPVPGEGGGKLPFPKKTTNTTENEQAGE